MSLQARPHNDTAPALPSVSTPAEARKLADGLLEAMTKLLEVIERETTLVRAGRIAGIGKAGNPDIQSDVTIVIGPGT